MKETIIIIPGSEGFMAIAVEEIRELEIREVEVFGPQPKPCELHAFMKNGEHYTMRISDREMTAKEIEEIRGMMAQPTSEP